MRYKIILLFSLFFLLLSCSTDEKKIEDYDSKPIKHTFSDSGIVKAQNQWWQVFNDEKLNSLMQKALSDNLDLKIAFDRLSQSMASVDLQDSTGGFNLNANARAARKLTQTEGQEDQYGNSYSVEFVASYEIDLWNRLESSTKSAHFASLANLHNTRVVALILSTQIAKTYFKLIEQSQKKDLLSYQIDISHKYLQLVTLKMQTGMATYLDVLQQKQSISSLETQQITNNRDYQKTKNELAKLIGDTPDKINIEVVDNLSDAPDLPLIYPIENLIKIRPDIQQAFASLQSASFKVSSLMANNYPKITLGASIASTAIESADLFKTFINQIFIQISQNLLDGGANSARVKQQEKVVQENLHNYEKTVINAIHEVENNLIMVKMQKKILENSKKEAKQSKNILKNSNIRYNNGDLDFQRLLNNITSWQSSELSYLQQQRLSLEYAINLYQATAGDIFKNENKK